MKLYLIKKISREEAIKSPTITFKLDKTI